MPMTTAVSRIESQPRLRVVDRQRSARGREWRRYERMLGPAGQRVLDALGLRGGERLLDVGCGAGGSTLAAAHRVGPSGSVVGIDPDPHAISVARARAGEQLLRAALFATGDASDCQLPSGVFDGGLSRFGLCAARDPASALAALRRALVPRAKLSLCTFREPARNLWFGVPRAVVGRVLGEQAERALADCSLGRASFELADRDRLERSLTDAGFGEVAIEALDLPVWVGDDEEDAIEFFFETDGRRLDATLDRAGLERLVHALGGAYAAHGRPDGVWLPGSIWLVSARAA